jgi:hypothetical protein
MKSWMASFAAQQSGVTGSSFRLDRFDVLELYTGGDLEQLVVVKSTLIWPMRAIRNDYRF